MENQFSTSIVWFINNLRLRDNPTLTRAVTSSSSIVPLFIDFNAKVRDWSNNANQMWWLHESLEELANRFRNQGLRLIRTKGSPETVIDRLCKSLSSLEAIFVPTVYRPHVRPQVEAALKVATDLGVSTVRAGSPLLHDPESIQTTSNGPYHVFTPFWNKIEKKLEVSAPLATPDLGGHLAPNAWPNIDSLSSETIPSPHSPQMQRDWTPGARCAHDKWSSFQKTQITDYDSTRDKLATPGTSRLSPHLHFGEISPRLIWRDILGKRNPSELEENRQSYLQEIAWREFAYHLLFHYPNTPTAPLKQKFEHFRWRVDPEALEAWETGHTGYPIVDAGIRQLRETGWMHNRARMIVASFLTKDLLLDWRQGARFFWRYLVDADLANNTMGWQWAAGCGADAQPFFRIFNPISQAEKHDPDGEFIRAFVPELSDLPTPQLFAPWKASSAVLKKAGLDLGNNYPEPIVDHDKRRQMALEEWRRIK